MSDVSPDSSYFAIPLSLVLVGAVFFIATAFGAGDLATFAGATLAFLLAIRAWSRIGLYRLESHIACDTARLFAGETFTVRAVVSNRKLLPILYRLSFPHAKTLVAAGVADSAEGRLRPFGERETVHAFRAARRGVHRFGPASLAAGDFLGLHERLRRDIFSREIIAYPRLAPISDLDLPFRDFFGIHPTKGIVEDPAWYEGTREYSGTRPARNIHWKASARLGILQEKIFEPTSHRKVLFIFLGEGYAPADDGASGDLEGFEKALEILAALAVKFSESGASCALATDRLVLGGPAALPPGRGPEHLGAMLEMLARCTMAEGGDIAALAEQAGAPGAAIAIVARQPSRRDAAIHALPSSRRARILFIYSRIAAIPPAGPHITFADLLAREDSEILETTTEKGAPA